ncbi:MAG: hypothetical protein ISR09_03830 [Candidatus Thalassarchaeum sp.]|nr:hypothetical protein [Candidatus Thalassarchaeum sp.]
MSRTLAMTQILVILLSILALTVSSVSAQTQGNEIIIDEIVEWTTEQDIEENIHITSEGELTISAHITFTSVSNIEIDEGGILKLIDNAEIISSKRATSLKSMGLTDEDNRAKIMIPTSIYAEEMKLTIVAEEGVLLNGSHVYLGDSTEPLQMSGEEFTINISEGEQDTELGFTGYGNFPIIKSFILETISGDIISEYKANSLSYQNMLIHGENGLNIDSAGTINISENSSITGANIVSSGEIIIKYSSIKDSCPIILSSDEAIITIENSEFSGSQEDHYLQLQPHSTINWGTSDGSNDVAIKGDLIDRWERVISDQSLIFDAIGVSYVIDGEGPSGEVLDIGDFSGQDGISYINGGRERVVEIGWANGSVTKENGIIVISEYRTAWNTEQSQIPDYGPSDTTLTWEQEIDLRSINVPSIEWVSLTISGNETDIPTGKSHQVSAIIANRGTVSANIYFDCDVTESGLAADIGGYQGAMIDSGEEIELNFGWRNNDQGEFGLSCEILTPTQLVDYENSTAFGGGEFSTSTINWEDSKDDSFNMIPIFIVIIIIIISGGVYFVHHLSNDAEETAEILEHYKKENIEDTVSDI